MLFCTTKFIYFFTILLLLYWSLPWKEVRIWLLLGASFFFYGQWSWRLAWIVCASTLIDYLIGLALDRSTAPRWRKLLLLVSLTINLGILCYFKYVNFFLDALKASLHAAGYDLPAGALEIPAIIGISFYTFEAINYVVDVYRRKVRAERNLAHFMLFILFFPHLVAGPIVRASDFLPQIRRPKQLCWVRMHLGGQFFVMGLFKKLALADRLSQYIDPVFHNPTDYKPHVVWLAMFCYAIQIYCDFSGYTDMAIGLAHMLGYKLSRNFNMPYLAANVAEFWHRWHISLSSWLRDYLFISLGGSRGTKWQTCRNLLITMTLGGLWHGAAWTFVAWGVLHGALLVAHRMFRDACASRPRLRRALESGPGTLFRMGLTFLAVCIGWVFFRATSFNQASRFLWHLIHAAPDARYGPMAVLGVVLTLTLVAVCHVLTARTLWQRWEVRLPAPLLGVSYALLVSLALLLAPSGAKPFIYFTF